MLKSKSDSVKSSCRLGTKKLARKSLGTRTKNDIICTPLKTRVSFSAQVEDYQPSAGLFEEEQDVEGKEVFKVTPLKRKSTKGIISASNSTPKSNLASSPKVETPIENRRTSRQRMKHELASLKTLSMESDPEDSDENSSIEENQSENDEYENHGFETPNKKKDKSAKTFSETYFSAQKQKKAATSNRTLSSLKLEQMNIEQLQTILEHTSEYHEKEKELLFKHYRSQFDKWKFLLHEGFNILLYGVGSKRKMLNDFCKECLNDALYVVVHGFFPSLNLKQILCSITEDALQYEGRFSGIHEHAEYIKKHFSNGKEELYLVFHNIDGMSLRNVKTQTLLSSLATIPNIHFVCSLDHINSPLIWDQVMLSHFKWVWFDVTTFEPYIIETSYENSIFKEQSSHLLLSSLLHVYHSLTPNGQGVFMILAKRQEEEKKNAFTGMAFHEWYQECREAFLVNSEITMQAQLSEFKNHKLLTSRKSIEGAEVWYIPVDDATLEQFLESCK